MNMTNGEIFADAVLHKDYSIIPTEERKCLVSLAEGWNSAKPLSGKKILFTGHYTRITLELLDLLTLAGADLYYTFAPDLVQHQDTLDTLKMSSLKDKEIPYDALKSCPEDYFDVAFDCGNYLTDRVTPKYGFLELTYTNPEKYKKLNRPTISVDMNKTKGFETFVGTGDGFVRAIATHYRKISPGKQVVRHHLTHLLEQLKQLEMQKQSLVEKIVLEATPHDDTPDAALLTEELELNTHNIASKKLVDKIESTYPFSNDKEYMVFGFGKVGQGICNALAKKGVKLKNITVVDVIQESCDLAKANGFRSIQLGSLQLDGTVRVDPIAKEKIIKRLKKSFCAVTATGVEGCISKHFDAKDFPPDIIKANMGTYNEWNDKSNNNCKFTDEELLNNGKPANFAEEYPTLVRYLDGIFKLLLDACALLVKPNSGYHFKNDIQPMPAIFDKAVLDQWQTFYPKELNEKVRRFFTITDEALASSQPQQAIKEWPFEEVPNTESATTSESSSYDSDHEGSPCFNGQEGIIASDNDTVTITSNIEEDDNLSHNSSDEMLDAELSISATKHVKIFRQNSDHSDPSDGIPSSQSSMDGSNAGSPPDNSGFISPTMARKIANVNCNNETMQVETEASAYQGIFARGFHRSNSAPAYFLPFNGDDMKTESNLMDLEEQAPNLSRQSSAPIFGIGNS